MRFTLRVLEGAGKPSACNNAEYQEKLLATIQTYIDRNGFRELARRYAFNLANGRFLWRNRVGAEQVEVQVRHIRQGKEYKSWVFDARKFDLRKFKAQETAEQGLKELTETIEEGLAGRNHVLLEVVAYVQIGAGQEVYPSQELILDRGSRRGQKSKTLYTVGQTAGMHSQKIGNAIRTIDNMVSG